MTVCFHAPYLSTCPLLPAEIPVPGSGKYMIHTTGRWRHRRSQGGCLALIRHDLDCTMVTPLKTERELLCLGKPSCVNLFELYSPSCMHSCLHSAIQKETICNNFSISHNCAAPGIQGDRNELWNGLVSVLQLFKSIGLRAFLSVCVWLRLKGMSFIAPTQVVPFSKDVAFMAGGKAGFGRCPWTEAYLLC